MPWLKKHGITFGRGESSAPSDGTLSQLGVDPPTAPVLPENPLGRVGKLGVDALS